LLSLFFMYIYLSTVCVLYCTHYAILRAYKQLG
jgi:hypothetical protein